MSKAQKQATRRYRARRRQEGLTRVEVQVPASEAAVIRKAATILRERAAGALRLRKQLGFGPPTRNVRSALDIFAMPEPLTAAGEALWEEAMAQVEHDRKSPTLNQPRKLDL